MRYSSRSSPLCLSGAVVGITLALPGGAQTVPRGLFTNCLINGIAALALAGVIQVWFTMGETRRANWEREQAARERARADQEREQAAQEREQTARERQRADQERQRADEERAARERERADRAENTLATTLLRLEELASEVADLRRRLDERANGHPSD